MINEERLFDKGIPSLKCMSIAIDLINYNCVSAENEKNALEIWMKRIFEINDIIYKESGFPFISLTNFVDFTLDENLRTHLCFDSTMVLDKVYDLIGWTDENIFDNIDEIREKAKTTLQDLNKIRMKQQLEKEFPKLYKEYSNLEKISEEYKDKTLTLNKISKMDREVFVIDEKGVEQYTKRVKELKDMVSRFGLDIRRIDFRTFINNVYKIFNKMLLRGDILNVMDIIASNGIDLQDFDGLLDESKFELLLAASHLSAAFARDEFRTENFSYVTAYLDEVKDTINDDMEVLISMHDGEDIKKDCRIGKKELFNLYKKFLLSHPEIQIFHTSRKDFEGKTLEDIQEYLDKYINEVEVSWEILPTDELSNNIYNRLGSDSLSIEEKQRIQDSKERIFDEKESFYQSHKPYCIIKGKNSFNGYIGFIYPNGKVILDQYYELNSNRIASSAIYVMEISEFIELSRKSKTEIIEGKLCQRIIHKSGWEEKTKKCFEGEVTPETLEDIQIAIKRLQFTK